MAPVWPYAAVMRVGDKLQVAAKHHINAAFPLFLSLPVLPGLHSAPSRRHSNEQGRFCHKTLVAPQFELILTENFGDLNKTTEHFEGDFDKVTVLNRTLLLSGVLRDERLRLFGHHTGYGILRFGDR